MDEIEEDDTDVEEEDGVTEEEPKEYDKSSSSWPSGTGSSGGSGSGEPPKSVNGVLAADTDAIEAGVDLSNIVGVWLNGLKVTGNKYTVTKQTVTMSFTMSSGTEWEILYY